MPNVLPYLRGTSGGLNAQVLYPFQKSVSFSTFIESFQTGAEQRWPTRAPLYAFHVPMTSLKVADRTAWINFMNTVKGRQAQDLQITLGATTYSNLTLLSDVQSFLNERPGLYNQDIRLRQVSNGSWTPPTPDTDYPTLSFGGVAERPFTQSGRFLTTVNDSGSGPRFTFSWYGAGISGFPTGRLRSWKAVYPLITDADVTTLESFFLGQQGMAGSFSFTDPTDGTTYTNVRFNMDDLTFHAITKNQWSTSIELLQTYNS